MVAWQSRPLDAVYPVLLVDGIRIKIRDGTVTNRTVYVVMGINTEGERDILVLWVGPSRGESAKFWLGVLTELKNRGISDCLVLCCDGLKGRPGSARAVWLLVDVQLRVVHFADATQRLVSRPPSAMNATRLDSRPAGCGVAFVARQVSVRVFIGRSS